VNLYDVLGYYSGLYFIRTDMEPAVVVRTLCIVHLLDAVLCSFIAANGGRSRRFWGFAGLALGCWAVVSLFFLSYRNRRK
jgi:hypothetical protein